MLKEFREFILRGNVIDLAIGVIIGGAFGKIVSSLVGDILMPLLGLALGKVDFSNLTVNLGGPVIKYGLFLNNVLDFLIIAFCIFITMKQINRFFQKQQEAKTKSCGFCKMGVNVAATRCPHCTSQIV